MRQGWNIPGSAPSNSVTRAAIPRVEHGSFHNCGMLSCVRILFLSARGWSIMKVGILRFNVNTRSDRQKHADDRGYKGKLGFHPHRDSSCSSFTSKDEQFSCRPFTYDFQ